MNVIEALVVTLGFDPSGFLGGVGKATSANEEFNESLGETQKQTEKTTKEQEKGTKSLLGFTKQLIEAKKNLLSFVEVYVGVKVFKTITQEVTESEAALYRLSSRIHTSVQDLQAWGNAAEIMGGNADEARQGLANLSNDITALKYKGEMSGRVQFLAQMGVSLTDAQGKTKDLLQIQEDLANSIERRMKQGMSREDARNLLQQQGYDQSTILLLTAEKEEREEILAKQREYNRLNEANAKESRDLNKSWREFTLLLMTLKSNVFHTFAPLLNFLVKCAIGVMHLVNSFPKLSGALGTLLMAFFPLLGAFRILKMFGLAQPIISAVCRWVTVLIVKALEAGSAFSRLWGMVRTGLSLFMRLTTIMRLLMNPWVAFIAVVGFLIKDLRDFGNNGKSIIDWAKIFDGIHSVIEWFGTLSDKLGEVWDKLKNRDWSGAWSSFKGIFTGGDSGATAGVDGGGDSDTASIIAEAAKDIGVNQKENHATIMQYQKDIGYMSKSLDAWCASFVGSKLEKAGFKSTRSAAAASYLNYGTSADMSKPLQSGMIGVLKRKGGSGYHVDFIEKDNGDGTVTTIDGNWGHGVKRVKRNKSDFASVRVPVSNGGVMPVSSGGSLNGKGNTKYDSLILAAARRHGIDPALMKAMMHTESQFNPNARSPVGAMGLMQLMPATARRFGVQNAWNPAENIEGGAKYMAYLLKYYHGDRTKAIAAYNGGEGNINKYGVGWVKENRDYVKRVSSHYRTYAGMGRGGMAKIPNASPRTLSAMNNSHLYANNTARSSEVHIGSININTQATDAHGIARTIPAALSNTMSPLAYGMDSGMNT